MKVVFVDSSISGHHLPYIQALAEINENALAILPEEDASLQIRQKICPFPQGSQRRLSDFLQWVREVRQIVDQEKPDIVHFLTGDDFYRFFGAGLSLFSRYKVVVTLHWMRSGFAGKLSTRCIAWQSSRVVVHSEYLLEKIQSYGIKDAVHIEYPQFGTEYFTTEEARSMWQLEQSIPVITCIGNTRYDKGLDILLEALNGVNQPFQLLVAGKAAYFSEEFIKEKTAAYRDRVRLHMTYLSEREYASAVCASDMIVLPYRKKFNGASGPLGDGVVHSKMIVGPSHGNLGETIRRYHLGDTFDSEDPHALSEVLNRAMSAPWQPDEQYRLYQEKLSPDLFQAQYGMLYGALI